MQRALDLLERDFATIDHIGPQRAADFEQVDPADRDDLTADAHGLVDDLLRACRA